jgi:hypothetical protein
MVRLLLLVLALGIVFWATQVVATADAFSTYVVRDALLLSLIGALIFVRAAPPPPLARQTSQHPRHHLLWLILLLVIAAGLRFWRLTTLPPDCLEAECEQALQLAQGPGTGMLFQVVAYRLWLLTGESLLSLRLAGALLGTLTVLAFYLAARRWMQPASALLATALLACTPWHIWASRSSDPWIALPLLICLLLWALPVPGEADTSSSRRAFALQLVSLLAIVLLILNEVRWLPWSGAGSEGWVLVALLFHGSAPQTSVLFAGAPLLNGLVAALALLGIGYAVRFVTDLRPGLLWIVTVLLALVAWRVDGSRVSPQSQLLILLPGLFLCAAVALDAIFRPLETSWQILIRPAALTGALLTLLLLWGLRETWHFQTRLASLATVGENPNITAISRALAQQLQGAEGQAITFFVPASVVTSPATRLLAGSALESGQVQPLENSFALLATAAPTSELRWFVPADAPAWLNLLVQLFPGGRRESQLDEQTSEPRFTTVIVSPQEWQSRQGLRGMQLDTAGAYTELPAGPLSFAWSEPPNLVMAEWQGVLLIPTTGDYGFGVDGAVGPFMLHLDGQPVLDTTVGFTEAHHFLPRGLYRLEMRYQLAEAGTTTTALAVRWQAPGRDWSIIPREALLNAPLPVAGLITTIYANDRWEGAPTDQRKDLILAAPADQPHPSSVRWQGQLRAGEYRFTLLAQGLSQVRIDEQLVIDLPTPPTEEATQAESVIYLSQGWHTFEARYAPAVAGGVFDLSWQPAGSIATALPSDYLAPLLPGSDTSRLPQPAPPPLLDPRLGDDGFALNAEFDAGQVQARIPPTNLPLLPFVLRWQAGEGCGESDQLLNQPHGVVIDLARNQILVADTANRRVAIFNLEGNLMRSWRDDRFQEPFDLHLGADGVPQLLDAVAQQSFRLNPTTGIVEPLPQEPSFYRPRGFAVDSLGNRLIADTGGARLVLLQPDGGQSAQFGGQGSFLGRGQPVDGLIFPEALWAITAEDGRLWRLESLGSFTATQPTNTLNGPHLAGLPTGAFFLSDPGRSLVLYHTANGQPRGQLASPAALITPTGVDAALINDTVYLAIVDSTNCTLSWWQSPAQALPQG